MSPVALEPLLRGAVETLMDVSPSARGLALQNLVQNNGGFWGIPENWRDVTPPCLFEISLFGVSVMHDDPETLHIEWLKTANRVIEAFAIEDAA
ncbi:MAG: hypothetical protein AAFN94_00715 [Pseudomonadota bacterium]